MWRRNDINGAGDNTWRAKYYLRTPAALKRSDASVMAKYRQ